MTDLPDPTRIVLDGLEADARVSAISRMDPTMAQGWTAEDRAHAIQVAQRWMECEGKSIADLAKRIGRSASTVSEVLSGKYRGDTDEILKLFEPTIDEYFRAKGHGIGPKGFVRHAVARAIYNVLRTASKAKDMAGIYGPSGIGKSFSLQSILSAEFPSAIYIEVNLTCRTPSGIYAAMVDAVRVRGIATGRGAQTSRMLRALIDRLRGSDRLIVIDEADGLYATAFNAMRQLWDATGCPIVFAGRPNLVRKIQKTRERDDIGGSFVGRMIGCFHLDDAAEDGTGPNSRSWICSVDEMAQMVSRFRLSFDREAIRWLTNLAHYSAMIADQQREAGALRLALSIAKLAAIVHKGTGAITVDLLRGTLAIARGRRQAEQIELSMLAESKRSAARKIG